MTWDRRGVALLVSTFVVALATFRGALVALSGGIVVERSPIVVDVLGALLVALVACRARRVLLDLDDDPGRD